MTDLNKTEIILIVDRSGSMGTIWSDTVGGFKNFIKEQKALSGKANLTLVTFDNRHDLVYDGVDIQDCDDDVLKDYGPRGSTALLDTMGFTMDRVGKRFTDMQEEERPGKVIVCVLTDGEENSSMEFNRDRIKEMVEHQTSKYNWQFIYLGANQDAFLIGQTMGFVKTSCANFVCDSIGAAASTGTLSRSVSGYRSKGVIPDVQTTYNSFVK